MKRLQRIIPLAAAALLLTGCARTGYQNFTIPEQGPSTLEPVDTIYRESHYTGIPPKQEKAQQTVTTGNGACVLSFMGSYYDVTLDFSKGTHYEVGAAYAEAAQQIKEDYANISEGYLYENIRAAFTNLEEDYSAVERRTEIIFQTLRQEYQEEINGFADTICGGEEGFVQDGFLSREEAILLQLVPDVLRGTACSAISADGSTTASGERITCRILEWELGSEKQLCQAHTLIHMRNGSESFTSVGYLGCMTILTGINQAGLMLSEYDVGSRENVPYTTKDKRSYTFDMRYILEHETSAQKAAAYFRDNAAHYPYCVNVLCTDAEDACVTELVVTQEDGTPIVRDSSTALHDRLVWEDPAYLCVVNAFAAKGNSDLLTYSASNVIRWDRYNALFCGQRQLTLDRFKELMTCEKTDNHLVRIRGEGMVHMVIADYDTHHLQAILTGTEGVTDAQDFIDLGDWTE